MQVYLELLIENDLVKTLNAGDATFCPIPNEFRDRRRFLKLFGKNQASSKYVYIFIVMAAHPPKIYIIIQTTDLH